MPIPLSSCRHDCTRMFVALILAVSAVPSLSCSQGWSRETTSPVPFRVPDYLTGFRNRCGFARLVCPASDASIFSARKHGGNNFSSPIDNGCRPISARCRGFRSSVAVCPAELRLPCPWNSITTSAGNSNRPDSSDTTFHKRPRRNCWQPRAVDLECVFTAHVWRPVYRRTWRCSPLRALFTLWWSGCHSVFWRWIFCARSKRPDSLSHGLAHRS